eukprot:1108656-Amphidinium_carterae.1
MPCKSIADEYRSYVKKNITAPIHHLPQSLKATSVSTKRGYCRGKRGDEDAMRAQNKQQIDAEQLAEARGREAEAAVAQLEQPISD